MVYIALSVIQSVLILITFKFFDRYRIDNFQAIVVNYLVAGTIGFLITKTTWTPASLPSFSWFSTSLVLGAMFICTFFFFALASQKVGVAVTSVASKMSLVIPIIISMIFWGESPDRIHIFGILIALAAFWLVFTKDEPIAWKAKYTYLPIIVFLGNGMVDTTMKYADHYHINGDLVLFLSVVFTTSLIIGLAILAFRMLRGKVKFGMKHVSGGIILGIINFGSTYYMLKAISVFESSVVFPVTNASIVGLSGLAGYFGFREKLSWTNIAGIFLSIIAILIIAYN
jgi:drug/metabolite transporter (DMT)-like permease